jgi:hypothetical protein
MAGTVISNNVVSVTTGSPRQGGGGALANPTISNYPQSITIIKNSIALVVSNDSKGDLYISKTEDFSTKLQAFIDALDPNRLGVQKVILAGDFTAKNTVIIPNTGKIDIQLTSTITISNDWNPSNQDMRGSSFKGVFQIGTRGGYVEDVYIWGGRIIGTSYKSPSGSVTDLANIYTDANPIFNTSNGLSPSGTNGNKPKIAYIFGEAVMVRCEFHHFNTVNVGTPCTFEGMAKIQGTPSMFVNIHDIIQEKCWVGCQMYGNGYEYQNCNIYNIYTFKCYDDCVAMCGGSGGVTGITYGFATFHNCSIWNIKGQKDGRVGAGVKVDGGVTFWVNGQGQTVEYQDGFMRHVNVYNVNLHTTGVNEHLVAIFNGLNLGSRNITYHDLNGSGTWQSVAFCQSSFVSIEFSKVECESQFGFIIQCGALPDARQSLRINEANLRTRNSAREGRGITFCSGANGQGQGIQNVKIENFRTLNVAMPISEGTPPIEQGQTVSPYGFPAVVKNIKYDIDINYSNVSAITINDCVLNSTNRKLQYSYEGVDIGNMNTY